MNTVSYIQFGDILQFLAIISIVTFLVSIFCIPLLIARLPDDYFKQSETNNSACTQAKSITVGFLLLSVVRNIFGMALLLAGVAMLFLPGQGIITIIIGLCFMDFPYKKHLIIRLTQPTSVRKSLNWIRQKMRKEPFYW